jgi:hypothetical protein
MYRVQIELNAAINRPDVGLPVSKSSFGIGRTRRSKWSNLAMVATSEMRERRTVRNGSAPWHVNSSVWLGIHGQVGIFGIALCAADESGPSQNSLETDTNMNLPAPSLSVKRGRGNVAI